MTNELTFWLLFLHGLAISDMVAILTEVDFLERPRAWLRLKSPRFLGKLATCVLCQSLWLAGLDILFGFPNWLVAWFALHKATLLVHEFSDRYLNRAPFAIFDMGKVQQPGPPVETTEGPPKTP